MKKLWHDDIRLAPDGWLWARTNAEAKLIFENHDIVEASLDHDLGLDGLDPREYESPHVLMGNSPAGTGYDLVKWMVATGHVPRRVTIHSYNPAGAERMAFALREYWRNRPGEAEVLIRPFDPLHPVAP